LTATKLEVEFDKMLEKDTFAHKRLLMKSTFITWFLFSILVIDFVFSCNHKRIEQINYKVKHNYWYEEFSYFMSYVRKLTKWASLLIIDAILANQWEKTEFKRKNSSHLAQSQL
jgi:hypothetical protein